MDTSDAFLEAICLEPDDDGLRLIYADWLEERGDADRAEFIRVQCELAAFWPTAAEWAMRPTAGRHDALERHERELLRSNAADWLPRECFPGASFVLDTLTPQATLYWHAPDRPHVGLEFRRGFVEQVTLTCESFAGGLCDWCRGAGRGRGPDFVNDRPRPLVSCPDCRGTGHTEGVAGSLFRAAPVREVVLSDRQPSQAYGKLCWFWGLDRRPDVIPKELWDLLPGKEVWEFRGRLVEGVQGTGYATRQAAGGALSAACVALGRRAAGLPALTPARAAAP